MGGFSLVMLLSCAICFAISEAGVSRNKREMFGDVDQKQIPGMLNNPAYVEAQRRCLVASEDEAKVICDRIGKKLRQHLIPSIRKGDCSSPCTDEEKKVIIYIITTVKTKYPKVWQDVIDFDKITPEELARVDKWVASSKS